MCSFCKHTLNENIDVIEKLKVINQHKNMEIKWRSFHSVFDSIQIFSLKKITSLRTDQANKKQLLYKCKTKRDRMHAILKSVVDKTFYK